jgi:hypothetical protein
MRNPTKSISFHSGLLWKLSVTALCIALMSGALLAQNQIVTGKKITPVRMAEIPMKVLILGPASSAASTLPIARY